MVSVIVSPTPFCQFMLNDHTSEINKRDNHLQFEDFLREILNRNENVINEYLNLINTNDNYTNFPKMDSLNDYINIINRDYNNINSEAMRMFCVYFWMHLYR